MTGSVKKIFQVGEVQVPVALHRDDGPEGALHVETGPEIKNC